MAFMHAIAEHPVRSFNTSLLAGAAVLLALSFNHMTKSTSHAVRFAMLLLFIGVIGQAIGLWLPTWDSWTDTLIFGGVVALLLANTRGPFVFPGDAERLRKIADRCSLGVFFATLFVVVVTW